MKDSSGEVDQDPGEAGPDQAPISGKRRGAQLLADSLIRHRISTIFGVPGDTGVSFYDALFERTDEIQHVLARDERHAVAMADAYARASNEIGVVEVSSGAGVSYSIGGMGEAFAASVPVLLISSDIHSGSRGTGALTEIDQETLYTAVTKWRAVVPSAAEIPALVDAAVLEATSGRPRPVALIVPEDVLDEEVDWTADGIRPPVGPELPARRDAVDHELAAAAARLLDAAERPVVVVGSGIHMSGAWRELEMLAERAALPVATTIHGKGAIADTSPWSLGVVGANGARDYANSMASSADAVLLIGTRGNATDTNSWAAPPRSHPNLIAIDIDVGAGTAAGNFDSALALSGDARTVLAQLLAEVKPADPETRRARQREIADAANAWKPTALDLSSEAHPGGRLHPVDVIRVCHQVLAGRCTVIADPGTPTPNVAAYWDTPEPGRSVLVPRGHGPMGYAIPAAVGAALARPEEPIFSITADGSFAMACGELETVARLGLPILYLQMTNFELGWIKMLQHLYFEDRFFGVEPGPIDAVAVAEACGIPGTRIGDLEQLEECVTTFLQDGRPRYLNVDVPDLMEVVPPVAPWQATLSNAGGRPVY